MKTSPLSMQNKSHIKGYSYYSDSQEQFAVLCMTPQDVVLGDPLLICILARQGTPAWTPRLINLGLECALIPSDPPTDTSALCDTLKEAYTNKSTDRVSGLAYFLSPTPFRIGKNNASLQILVGNTADTTTQASSPTVYSIDLGQFNCHSNSSECDAKLDIVKKTGAARIAFKLIASIKKRVARQRIKRRLRGVAKTGYYAFTCPERLGHLMMDTLVRIAEDIDQGHTQKQHATWVFPRTTYALNYGWIETGPKIANSYFVKMLKRLVNVADDLYAEDLQQAKYKLNQQRAHQHRDVTRALQKLPPLLEFTGDEELLAQAELHRMGIQDQAKFVIIHLREKGYESSIYGEHYSTSRYSYRNPDWLTYRKAANWLLDKGYYVILMGSKIDDLESTHPHLINYSSEFRTEFMDIWLGAHCYFFVGTTSGSWALAAAFKRPILYTNFFPYTSVHAWEENSMVLFQKVIDNTDGGARVLEIEEILRTPELASIHLDLHPIFWSTRTLIPNTEDQILEAVEELTHRCEGNWMESIDDQQLQRAFWRKFQPSPLNLAFRIRVGSKFLQQSGLLSHSKEVAPIS